MFRASFSCFVCVLHFAAPKEDEETSSSLLCVIPRRAYLGAADVVSKILHRFEDVEDASG